MSTRYQKVLAVLAVVVFFSNLDLYLFENEILPFVPPAYWIAGFALLTTPILFSQNSLSRVLRSPVAACCLGFLGITALWFFFQSSQSDAVIHELRLRISSMLFLGLMLFAFCDKGAQTWARWAMLFVGSISVLLNISELFLPLEFSNVLGRSAGLYLNPTISGMALVLGMILVVDLLSPRFRVLFVLFMGLGVFLTLSRASIAGWILAVISMLLTRTFSLRKTVFTGALALTLCAFALLPWWNNLIGHLRSQGVFDQNVIARLEFFRFPEFSDDSSVEREALAKLAWKSFGERPLFGNGIAASREWELERSSHNQYLNLMTDHGILGALILPLFVWAAAWRANNEQKRIGYAFSIFILWMGFFSHNILDERYSLLAFALVASLTRIRLGDETGDTFKVYRRDVEARDTGWEATLRDSRPALY